MANYTEYNFFTKVENIYLKWEKCILLYFVYCVYFLDYGKKINTGVNKHFLEHGGLCVFIFKARSHHAVL